MATVSKFFPERTAAIDRAAWSLGKWRYFFLDQDNSLGYAASDGNAGYIDAAAGSVFAPGDLTGIPIKTFERLFQILPRLGDGRSFKVLVIPRAAGATYKEQDGTTDAVVNLGVLTGYNHYMVCGSTDLTNSVADRVMLGALRAVDGPNADKSWTVDSGATVNSIPISAGTLTAEPGIVGFRARLTGNVTSADANACAFISANTSSALTITRPVGLDITAPASGDKFFIERPGVRVGTLTVTQGLSGPQPTSPAIDAAVQIVGLAVVSAQQYALSFVGLPEGTLSFCEQIDTTDTTQFSVQRCGVIQAHQTYTTEGGGSVIAGSGVRVNGGFQFSDVSVLTNSSFAWVSATASSDLDRFTRIGAPSSILGLGSYLAKRLGVRTSQVAHAGSAIVAAPTRAIGGIRFQQIRDLLLLVGLEATQAGAAAAILIESAYPCIVGLGLLSGSTGNTGWGLDVTGVGAGGTIKYNIDGDNTVHGTAGVFGELLLAGDREQRHVYMDQFRSFWDYVGCQHQGEGAAGSQIPPFPAMNFTNNSSGFTDPGIIFCSRSGANDRVGYGQADTSDNSMLVVGPCVAAPFTATAKCLIAVGNGPRLVQFDGTITAGLMCYLSDSAAGRAVQFTSTTGPTTGYKVRLGVCLSASALTGTAGIIDWRPEQVPTPADGLP